MIESSSSAGATHDALRREGKDRRPLQENEKVVPQSKRRIEEVGEEIAAQPHRGERQGRRIDPGALAAHKDKVIADCYKQIKEMKQQLREFNAIEEEGGELTEEEELEVESLCR